MDDGEHSGDIDRNRLPLPPGRLKGIAPLDPNHPDVADGVSSGPHLLRPGQGAKGRGAGLNPANRFQTTRLHILGEALDDDLRAGGSSPDAAAITAESSPDADLDTAGGADSAAELAAVPPPQVPTTIYADTTRTIINRVDSPDIGFEWSLNPYRGCEHGCIYCYARPGHEYLSLSCGLDFETRIFAKHDAPDLLRAELSAPSWRGATIAMSGVTDCYQPIERQLRLTRRCLEVMLEFRQSVSIVTKSGLIVRDLDILQKLAELRLVQVAVSLTTLDPALARTMEPRASSPAQRQGAMRRLSAAGVPVAVMTAPIIPGLNDHELPALLKAAASAGATRAGYVLLRLPYQIKALFQEWLLRHYPQRAAKVESLIRQCRNGQLNDARANIRFVGEGAVAEQIRQTFELFCRRYGLNSTERPAGGLDTSIFRRPSQSAQLGLFGSDAASA